MSAPMDTAPTDGTHFLAKWEDFETGQTIGWVETWYAVPAGKIGGWESPWEYAVAGLYGPVAWASLSATDTRLAEDASLLLDAYKALLVLHRVMDKHGLAAGALAAGNIADRIVAAHPEIPSLCALPRSAQFMKGGDA